MQIIDETNKIVNLCFCKYLNLNHFSQSIVLMFQLVEEVLQLRYNALLVVDFLLSSFLIVFISFLKSLNLILVLVLQIFQLKTFSQNMTTILGVPCF